MEVEERLLSAIDQLAKDGDVGEIRCLAALIACRGKVEMLNLGFQNPFRTFAEQEGDALQQHLRGLVRRGIVIEYRDGTITLNSYIVTRNKDFLSTRCANRLFARARPVFAKALANLPFKEIKDLGRLQTNAAANRAYRAMGGRYRELKRFGLLVTSNRTDPRVFHSLRRVEDVPWATAVALTLEQANALTRNNLVGDCGIAYHLAVAMGYLEEDSDGKNVALTERGRQMAVAYTADSIRRRVRWIGDSRPETMHLLLDELLSPMPAVWITGTLSQVNKTWRIQPEAPLRILFKERQMRLWIRKLVRRLDKLGIAQLVSCSDGVDRYFFAPNVSQLAKDALDLPAERFALPPEQSDRFAAFSRLLNIARDDAGQWRLRASQADVASAGAVDDHVKTTLRHMKKERLIKGPSDDGSYIVADADGYRWTLVGLLMDPITEFMTTDPEEEEAAEQSAPALRP